MATQKSKKTKPMSEHEKQMVTAAIQAAHEGLLDEPGHHDKPSPSRHTAYFLAVLALGAVVNIVALVLVAR
jgi:hypothetical protein